MDNWQKATVIIASSTFIRLVIKDILDIHSFKRSRKKCKKKNAKTSRKSPKR